MLHDRFFLIEPLNETSAKLARFLSEDELALCCSPQSISHQVGDKSAWTEADVGLIVKLAYLVQTLDIFQDEDRRVRIFGQAAISESLFDRWWALKPITHLGRTTECSEELRSYRQELHVNENGIVRNWLQQVMAE